MNRPHVIVNVASSVDGKIDSSVRTGLVISSSVDKHRVDALRASVDAVLVGGHTLLREGPGLTVRSEELRLERVGRGLDENPAKVGVVTIADLPIDSAFITRGSGRRMIFTTSRTAPEPIKRLGELGVETIVHETDRVDLIAMLACLQASGIKRLLVEGGGTIIAEFLRLRLVDEIYIYVAPKIIGGASAPTLADGSSSFSQPGITLTLDSVKQLDPDGGVLLHYFVQNEPR
jgi:2,5-diamino-6-(ribosylamino)-4(3H)-pyrimidinone 5'-phosphate reductase